MKQKPKNKADGKYKRTLRTMIRQAQTRDRGQYTEGGRIKEGKLAPRPITLPSTPWNK